MEANIKSKTVGSKGLVLVLRVLLVFLFKTVSILVV